MHLAFPAVAADADAGETGGQRVPVRERCIGMTGSHRVSDAPALSEPERAALLRVARAALGFATGLVPAAQLEREIDGVRNTRLGDLRGAAFVTLSAGGQLRACMGTAGAQPLPDAVADAALSAALHDPRFYPLQAVELPFIGLEISVLGPLAALTDLEDLRPGVDGVVVERDRHRGLLLPEVATRMGWDGPDLLRAVCQKAGLPDDAWRLPGTRVSVFRTVHFGGPGREP